MLKHVTLFCLAVAALAALVTPSAAPAATTEDCQASIATLVDDLGSAESEFANVKDRTGLLGKADAASRALAAGKPADAVQKLTDIRAKLAQLSSAAKLPADDAARMDAEAAAAIRCIQEIA
jgi:hypothetical protein